jgi:hypothetical protein
MSDYTHESMLLEQIAKEHFGLDLEVRQLVASEIPISYTGSASVFLTTKKQLYVYIHARSALLLGDVQKLVSRMGLRAELYVPPKGQSSYFDDIARKKFAQVYPGRVPHSEADLRYYRTLAPYNPALAIVQEVKNGEIKRFDTDASGGWRTTTRFAYRRIKTS